ncbi:formate dehydrogenase accessory sulfurtransferase FdhD [Pseudooceanicola sp. LIPI14-2-Ac024]|uniref:formate dehydrogenase accessory sulfurtransferase FdhD n=1 Tax=Pseudooceanicola sp. LIPI14-2-Ac024 TaxID=3344875 RepID=UPI0035CF875A
MTAFRGGRVLDASRMLPEERPVAIVAQGSSVAVMMCSPADLENFAFGFCLTEGIIDTLSQVESLEIAEQAKGIEVRLWLASDRAEALAARRRFMAGPVGCGMCGIDSLDQAMRDVPRVGPGPMFDASEVAGAPEAMRALQPMHDRARAVHAAGFLVPGQGIVAAREDVGRHNALDKLIGALAREGADRGAGAAVLTSRVSVEMVQKCAMAGIPAIVAVSAPTTLAVEVAQAAGITLAAAARDGGFELWSGAERIAGEWHVA